MKLIYLLILVGFFFGCSGTNGESASEEVSGGAAPKELNGTWRPVMQKMQGNTFADSMLINQRLIIDGDRYTIKAESIGKGGLRFNGNKIDIYGTEGVNEGRHYTAIYKMENGRLVICYNLEGGEYPESFDVNDNSVYFLSVFEKEK